MTVPSPKTEHHAGGQSRDIPLFPELRQYLEAVREQAEPGTEYVTSPHRGNNQYLRTQLARIIRRTSLLCAKEQVSEAGLEPARG
jgi:hypothetical protein